MIKLAKRKAIILGKLVFYPEEKNINENMIKPIKLNRVAYKVIYWQNSYFGIIFFLYSSFKDRILKIIKRNIGSAYNPNDKLKLLLKYMISTLKGIAWIGNLEE